MLHLYVRRLNIKAILIHKQCVCILLYSPEYYACIYVFMCKTLLYPLYKAQHIFIEASIVPSELIVATLVRLICLVFPHFHETYTKMGVDISSVDKAVSPQQESTKKRRRSKFSSSSRFHFYFF